ncbi:MAG: DUF2147 domain-containing protein [Pseudomonadota bacterium]
MRHSTVTALCALVFAAVGFSANAAAPYGLWMTANKRAIVEIAPCSDSACGRIVWMANAFEDDGSPKRDMNNPDESLRSQPLCGITLVGDLMPREREAELYGFIYNPRDGKKYSARVSSLADDKIEMRGFLGLEIFGKSETWTRVAHRPSGC